MSATTLSQPTDGFTLTWDPTGFNSFKGSYLANSPQADPADWDLLVEADIADDRGYGSHQDCNIVSLSASKRAPFGRVTFQPESRAVVQISVMAGTSTISTNLGAVCRKVALEVQKQGYLCFVDEVSLTLVLKDGTGPEPYETALPRNYSIEATPHTRTQDLCRTVSRVFHGGPVLEQSQLHSYKDDDELAPHRTYPKNRS